MCRDRLILCIILAGILLVSLVGCSTRPVVDYSFIRFNDAAPCVDYGALTSVMKSGVVILKLPFLLRIYEEGQISKESYPATENQIDEHLQSALEKRYKVLIPNKQYPHMQIIAGWFKGALERAAKGTEPPLAWGQNIPEGTLDKGTYIYFPLGIERESRAHINARFYVLIANHEGKVLFARCVPYNPNLWSLDAKYFKEDIEGKLPLLNE